jgi:hypothetical protein
MALLVTMGKAAPAGIKQRGHQIDRNRGKAYDAALMQYDT